MLWGIRTCFTRSATRLVSNGLKQTCIMLNPSYQTVSHRIHGAMATRSSRHHDRAFSSGGSLKDDGAYTTDESEYSEIQRFALPEGISQEKFGLYELLDSSKDMRNISGVNSILAVHGDERVWLPHGREGHGSGGGMFAVIGTSGTQYKVMAGDVLYTNRQQGEVNTQIAFDWVLAIGTFDWTVFGRPLIRQARVLATIEEQAKSGKVIVAKFKKRKGYRRRKGHRQPLTRFRIDKIEFELPDASMIKPYEVPYDPNKPPVPSHLRSL